MPGFDGTGPLGKGPMTGQGRGFCVLRESEDDAAKLEGFAGVDGVPVARLPAGPDRSREEPTDASSATDRTGRPDPGPVAKRAAGVPVRGYGNHMGLGVAPASPRFVRNLWLGFGPWFGRGRRWGCGRGRLSGRW